MPRFNFTDKKALDLSQFAIEEWVDLDLADADDAAPPIPADPPKRIKRGQLLFDELGCAGCHALTDRPNQPPGPDLTFIGSKPVHDLGFGAAPVRHTLPDFLYTKLTAPRSLTSDFRLSIIANPADAIWKNLQPTALFSKSAPLPAGSEEKRLAWILAQVQARTTAPPGWQPGGTAAAEEKDAATDGQSATDEPAPKPAPVGPPTAATSLGMLAPELQLPDAPPRQQAAWLVKKLNAAGLLNPLKMPDFGLAKADAEALTIALMSHSEERVASRRYDVPRKREVIFNPQDDFGQLERRYRCLSCHGIRGSGDIRASDLTLEGSRANRDWLYAYLKEPYGMRRTLTIAMPLFNFPDEEARFMAEYISQVFVDSQIGTAWKRLAAQADAQRGKVLFDMKGCFACHRVNERGGDIGPALTAQVPSFPVGTWVGDKLRGEWMFQWLKDPQALVPGTVEPNLGLSDGEAADLTAYLLSLKSPEFAAEKSVHVSPQK